MKGKREGGRGTYGISSNSRFGTGINERIAHSLPNQRSPLLSVLISTQRSDDFVVRGRKEKEKEEEKEGVH